jgi:16S rRNA (uracil1498-N3)-methyltransferase
VVEIKTHSKMDRFFLTRADWGEGELVLRGEEAHHCVRVMRKDVGERIELFDGEGHWARGNIVACSKEEVRLAPDGMGTSAPLQPEVTLCLAIPKGKNMELIVQKSVELGVAAIQPLVTAHSVVRLDDKDSEKKREKWQRIALEACKQCGQNHLPRVEPPREMSSWLTSREPCALDLIASLAEGSRGFREFLRAQEGGAASVSLLVGPEGDFSAAETEAALAAGYQAISLGDIVLRVETAALYVVGGIRYEFGN